MRRARQLLAPVLLACLLALGLAGCQQTLSLTATELTASVRPASEASVEMADATTTYDFALDLLRESTAEAPSENTLVSLLSVLYALAMAENGADGETLTQMEQATGMSVEELTGRTARRSRRWNRPPG